MKEERRGFVHVHTLVDGQFTCNIFRLLKKIVLTNNYLYIYTHTRMVGTFVGSTVIHK